MHLLVDYDDVTHVMRWASSTRSTVCEMRMNWRSMEIIGKFPTCLWCVASGRRTAG